MSPPVWELREVTAGYPDRLVLQGISLRVAAGDVLAVLGANGSGKSTLIKTALGLVPVTAGEVRWFGSPLARLRRRHRIGYVPQRVGAGSGVPATVTELVSSGRLARRRLPLPRTAGDQRAAAEAIAAVGLTERAGDPVASLSGGQQQRALIARAMATEPEVLVLDEPTAGVDAGSQLAFAGALRRFVTGGGTVVLVAHELGPLEPLVTRAMVLHEGRVVHDGPVPAGARGQASGEHDVHPHAPADPPPILHQPRVWQPGGLSR